MNPKRNHSEIGLSQSNRLDRAQSVSIQKKLKLLYEQAKSQDLLKHYKKIKFQGFIYKLGEFVLILKYGIGMGHHYVAKIVDFVEIKNLSENDGFINNKIDIKCPILIVEWYMKKAELPKTAKFEAMCDKIISDFQVFSSGVTFALPMQSIYQKCEVLEFKEYWVLNQVESSIFFSRASFNSSTQTFTPSIEEWEKYCICQKPYNPDLSWTECDSCKEWFHDDCIWKDKNGSEYICPTCVKKTGLEKKKKR